MFRTSLHGGKKGWSVKGKGGIDVGGEEKRHAGKEERACGWNEMRREDDRGQSMQGTVTEMEQPSSVANAQKRKMKQIKKRRREKKGSRKKKKKMQRKREWSARWGTRGNGEVGVGSGKQNLNQALFTVGEIFGVHMTMMSECAQEEWW